jgi:tRNA threonylcarbamoyladenosine biosynthesis protein TsaB
LYKVRKDSVQTILEDQILQSTDWAETLRSYDEKILFIGNDLPLHKEVLQDILKEQAEFAPPVSFNPRPSELAFLGLHKPDEDVHTFVPNYVRLAEAEANWLSKQKEK